MPAPASSSRAVGADFPAEVFAQQGKSEPELRRAASVQSQLARRLPSRLRRPPASVPQTSPSLRPTIREKLCFHNNRKSRPAKKIFAVETAPSLATAGESAAKTENPAQAEQPERGECHVERAQGSVLQR